MNGSNGRNGSNGASPLANAPRGQASTDRTSTALVPFNPNQPENHARIMQEVQAKRDARHAEAKALSAQGGVDIKARAAALAPHVNRLAAEQQALQKWNTDGSGRNQGLRHLLDYALAPPPKDHNSPVANSIKTGKGIRAETGMSRDDLSQFARGTASQATGLTPKGQRLQQQRDAIDQRMKASMQAVPSSQRRNVAQSPGYQMGKWDMANLDEDIREETYFTAAQDISKKGRLEKLAESKGAPRTDTVTQKRDFLRDSTHNSLIIGATQELDRLSTHASTTTTTQGSAGGTVTLNDQWVKTGTNANGTAKWEKRDNVTIANTATSTEHNTNSNNVRHNIKKWGVSPTKQLYSTVMGKK